MFPRLARALLVIVVLVLCIIPVDAIVIDGHFNDWTTAEEYDMPAEVADNTASPYAAVEKLWVAHDDDSLYFRIRFAEPRPFAGDDQRELKKNFWSNMRYILLDVDGDSQPDYQTTQISREHGYNYTYVVKLMEPKNMTYLWFEGHPDWDNGPRGHFSPDGHQIEIRVPIEPLNIQTSTIGIQVKMSLRDGLKGPNEWTDDRYPSRDEFFLYNLTQGAKIETTAPEGVPSVTMHQANEPPDIDGNLDDTVWQQAPVLSGFILNRGNTPAPVQTRARVAWDHENLYFAVRADEPQMENLKTDAVEAEAKRVWRDDCIEVFIDYHNDDATYYHLGVTAAGMTAGQFGVSSGSRNVAIDLQPDVNTAYRHLDDGWIVEFAFPFSNLGVDPVDGEIWGLNICRARPGGRKYSSWAGVQGRFAQPAEFGDALYPSESGLTVTSRGMAARAGNSDEKNTVRGTYDAPEDATLAVSVTTGTHESEVYSDVRQFEASAATPVKFSVPYIVGGEDDENVWVRIAADDRTIYKNSFPVVKTEFPKVWQTDDPLYEELLGEKGPGMAAEGAICWSHDLVSYRYPPFCVKYAQPYVLHEKYERAGEKNLHYLENGTLLGRDNFNAREYCKKYGVTTIYMPGTRAHAEGKPLDESGHSYIIDYENQEAFLQRIRDYLPEWQHYMWAVSTGDEVMEHDLTQGLKFHYDEDPYPFMEQVNREVKDQFGYGEYGIPESLNDKNPFRWIAYRRWYNDRFAKFQQKIYETVKGINLDLHVIGPDPIAQVQPWNPSGYGKYCDILTHQVYPRGADEQDAAWITKTLRDLGGQATMPCTHVENYASSFRPAEVREIMSQVYRAGGEGFHLYLPDTSGRQGGVHDMRSDEYGSWPRWATIMGTLDNAANNNRPDLPESTGAILYSNDAYMASFLGGRQGDDQYRWMFNLLGPSARGWFTVISDNQIARDEVNLSGYTVIYVPQAAYQRREVVEILAEYVEGGGNLLVTQPEAFTWHLDGTKMDALREELFAPAGKPADHESVSAPADAAVASNAGPMSVWSQGAGLEVGEGVDLLLEYEDGSAAAVRKPVGDGYVYSFGFEPMYQRALKSAAWREYWKSFHRDMGQEVDLDIWRFMFPPVPGGELQPPDGRCLTNNYVMWDTNEMIPVKNLEIPGTYSYSIAPDYADDQGGVTDVAFANGDLMDRRSAMEIKDGEFAHELKHFGVGWNTAEPVTIIFDLKAAHALDRIWLIYNRALPETTVEGHVDGEWQIIGSHEGHVSPDRRDYPAATIPLNGPPVQQVRITFAGADEERRLIIPEIEIWAEE